MAKKKNKTKVTKVKDACMAGIDAKQVLANSLCKQFLKVGVNKEDIDIAFIAAFQALSDRMFSIFEADFVLEKLAEMAPEHICNDYQHKIDNNIPVQDLTKLH